MARNTTLEIPARTWTQITNDDATFITFQNQSNTPFFLKGTTDATTPVDDDGSIAYPSYSGEKNVALEELFPGIAAVRLFVWAEYEMRLFVSHA